MHEMSLLEGLFSSVLEIAGDNGLISISSVKVAIGTMRQIDPHSLTFAFDVLKKGTIAEHARLEIIILPIIAECSGCFASFKVKSNTFLCPYCGCGRIGIIQGKEIILQTIDGEQ